MVNSIFQLKFFLGWGLLCLGSLVISETGFPASVKDIEKQLKKRYDKIQDLSAEFVRVMELKALEQTTEIHGRLQIKKKNKFRMETPKRTIVSDGQWVWTYLPDNQQILVNGADRIDDESRPDRFLVYHQETFIINLIGEEKRDKKNYYVLKLIPRDVSARLKERKVWVDQKTWLVRRIEDIDLNSNRVIYDLIRVQINTGLDDQIFRMETPAGVEVIDLR